MFKSDTSINFQSLSIFILVDNLLSLIVYSVSSNNLYNSILF